MDSTPTPHDQYGLANIAIILGQATVLNKANSGNTATYFTATTKRALKPAATKIKKMKSMSIWGDALEMSSKIVFLFEFIYIYKLT